MNTYLLVISLIVVGWAGGRLLTRRIPKANRAHIFAATAAFVGAIGSVASRPNALVTYASLAIGVVMATFLLMTWLQPRTPPQAS